MTVITYYSAFICDSTSLAEVVNNTSSQIFLSGGIAGTGPDSISSPAANLLPSTTSILESATSHLMMFDDALPQVDYLAMDCETNHLEDAHINGSGGCHLVRDISDPSDSSYHSNTFPPTTQNLRATTAVPPRTNPRTPVEFVDEYSTGFKPVKIIDKLRGKESERGRTSERTPRCSNPFMNAESRSRGNDTTILVDARPIEKRDKSWSGNFFDNPHDPCAVFEDSLFEPCPHTHLCNSVSEIMNGLKAPSRGPGGISGTRNIIGSGTPTCEMYVDRSSSTIHSIVKNGNSVSRAPEIGYNDGPIMKSSVSPVLSSWEVPNSSKLILKRESCLASRMPTEIIQQIFYNLTPADFNSARHTCRSWFINSLNLSLLEMMLKRAGFSSSIQQRLGRNQALNAQPRYSDEWLMSQLIARECALGPDWTGNGVSARDGPPELLNRSAFLHTTTVNFSDHAIHDSGTKSAGTVFTVSSCSRYVMTAHGCLVYIYELECSPGSVAGNIDICSSSLRPVSSIICPRQVLACSMDTSSQRYAIAILLEGRMGLVCDISSLSPNSAACSDSERSRSREQLTSFSTLRYEPADSPQFRGSSFPNNISLGCSSSNSSSKNPPLLFPGTASARMKFSDFLPVDEAGWEDVFETVTADRSSTAASNSRFDSSHRVAYMADDGRLEDSNVAQSGDRKTSAMLIETGSRSLYRNLCSDDDPPRSVAICPQRRCVAFGCSSGIELHWVDALTGQDLNRWFPLTAPSDFLFFLPPRKSVDSVKKLRIISSAGRPSERTAIHERHFGGRKSSSPFWKRYYTGSGSVEPSPGFQDILSRRRGDGSRSLVPGRMDCSDHYRAIPLSDGCHILFTDPATGILCLGSDAPVGGPTKLLRKIWFQGPESDHNPIVYAAGADMSCGVRVAAVFRSRNEDSIWFFSVPGDIFNDSQPGQPPLKRTSTSSFASSYEDKTPEWVNWWPDDGLQEWLSHTKYPVPGILSKGVWPVKIRGQKIGVSRGVVDIAVGPSPRIAVWAFNKEGLATVWRLDDGSSRLVERKWVVRDGTIRGCDSDGDIEMSDAPDFSSSISADPLSQTPESFDGTSSLITSVLISRPGRSDRVEWTQHKVQYDSSGNVLMDDLFRLEKWTESVQKVNKNAVLDEYGDEVWDQRDIWSKQDSQSPLVDLVEELTGMTRVHIEIR